MSETPHYPETVGNKSMGMIALSISDNKRRKSCYRGKVRSTSEKLACVACFCYLIYCCCTGNSEILVGDRVFHSTRYPYYIRQDALVSIRSYMHYGTRP